MGNHLKPPTLQDYSLHNLPGNLSLDEKPFMDKSRFMKSLKCFNDEGKVVVKVYVKHQSREQKGTDYGMVAEYERELEKIATTLRVIKNSNAFPFQTFVHTEKAGYMLRQYFHNNLYDRISTRPFLVDIEKLWLTYLLVCAVDRCHSLGITHGDIKCENVLVTSWNWLYLSDFAPYKPTFIPEDNNGEFDFYFDSMGRRKCYLAPERFYPRAVPKVDPKALPPMDIFSLGCVIAELWMEGKPLFTYSELLSYKRGQYDPSPKIDQIPNPVLRDLILNCVNIDPSARPTAKFEKWRPVLFPAYFGYLHNYLFPLIMETPDRVVLQLASDVEDLFKELKEPVITVPFCVIDLSDSFIVDNQKSTVEKVGGGDESGHHPSNQLIIGTEDQVPPKPVRHHEDSTTIETEFQPGVVMIFDLLASMVRHIREIGVQLKAIDLFDLIASRVNDNIRLQRLVPYLFSLLEKKAEVKPLLVARVIKSITRALQMVTRISYADLGYFPEYILPLLASFTEPDETPSILIRSTMAQCLASLAETSKRFLELSFLQTTEDDKKKRNLRNRKDFPAQLADLRNSFREIVERMFAVDSPRTLKIALLTDISLLANFFGQTQTNQILLPLLISCLNDRDKEFKVGFFTHIVGVCAVSGAESVESYILPCILPEIYDKDETVAGAALQSLVSLCEIQILTKHTILEISDQVAPLLLHPNSWIRFSTVSLITKIVSSLSQGDVHCYLLPRIRPFLNREIAFFSEDQLLCSLDPAISRRSVEKAFNSANYEDVPHDVSIITNSPTSVIVSCTLQNLRDVLMEVAAQHKAQKKNTTTNNQTIKNDEQQPNTPPDAQIPEILEGTPGTPVLTDDPFFELRQSRGKTVYVTPGYTPVIFTQPEGSETVKKQTEATLRPESNQESVSAQVEKTQLQKIAFAMRSAQASVTLEEEERIYKMGAYFKKAASQVPLAGQAAPKIEITFRVEQLSVLAIHSVNSLALEKATTQKEQAEIPVLTWLNTEYNDDKWDIFGRSSISAANSARHRRSTTMDPLGSQPATPPAVAVRRGGPRYTKSLPTKFSSSNPAVSLLPQPKPQLGTILKRTYGNVTTPVTGTKLNQWRPRGTLVANFTEHRNAITALKPTKDNLFFASGSRDGTVRIWDCQRLEKNVKNQSCLQYQQKGQVNAITICENSHSVASASSLGSVDVFRVEYLQKDRKNIFDYHGTQHITTISHEEGPIIDICHYESDSQNQSLLVFMSQQGILHGYDLRAKREAWSIQCDQQFGLVHTFAAHPSNHWIVIGTNTGNLCGWDMRFRLPFRQWGSPTKAPIYSVVPNLSKHLSCANTSMFCASFPGEFHLWDLDTGKCSALFQTLYPKSLFFNTSEPKAKLPVDPRHSLPEPLLSNHSIGSLADEIPTFDTNVRALYSPPESNFVLAAGNDKKIHYWDLENVESSYIMSGQDEVKPKYKSYKSEDLIIFEEYPDPRQIPCSDIDLRIDPALTPPSNNHNDTISALTCLEIPSCMVVSGSRDGVIKVWR